MNKLIITEVTVTPTHANDVSRTDVRIIHDGSGGYYFELEQMHGKIQLNREELQDIERAMQILASTWPDKL